MPVNKDPEIIKKLFNMLSVKYDFLNNIISLGRHKPIKKDAIKKLELQNDFKVLDLCTGTGDIAFLLNKENPKLKIMGVDFSTEMIKISQSRNTSENIDFIEGDVEDLPFLDDYFDVITISFGLRNVHSIDKTLDEIKRVLKPDGQALIMDLGKPKDFLKPYANFYFKRIIVFVAKMVNKDAKPFEYLYESNEDFPSQEELNKILLDKGFKDVNTYNYLFRNIQLQIAKGLK